MRLFLAVAASLAACALPVVCLPPPHSTAQPRKRALSGIIMDPASVAGQAFDYVIVGGGLTGIVAATRLSEESNKRVLLVEAGGDTRGDDKIKTLRAYSHAFGDDRYDWAVPTGAQAASGNKSYTMHQGKGLGGSSSINGGVFTLPPASQIDALATLGNTGWSFNDLLPYMKKSQMYHAPGPAVSALGATADMASHGTNGPIDIGFSDRMFTGPQERAFLAGQSQALGAPTLVDLGNGQSGGAALIPQTTLPDSGDARTRESAATGYLTPSVLARANLVILTNCRATRMVYHNSMATVTASGVLLQAHKGAPIYTVNAKRVIVAAGAIRTPVFLELSGIDDDGILGSIGVQKRVILPGVGRNLCEQQKNNVIAGPPRSPIGGSGSPSSAISMNTLGQLVSNASDNERATLASLDKWAQQAVEQGGAASKEGLLLQYRIMVDGIFHKDWPVAETLFVSKKDVLIQQMWALLSFSRGSVHTASPSTWDVPELEPRYWSASIDMDMQVAANRGARRVFESTAMKDVLAGGESAPGYATIPASSEGGAYGLWRQYILDSFESVWHPLGTAAMLPEASGGVVDAGFKVYHTQNIYVIDASILPMQISTHLTSVLYGVAEKAAAMLKTT